MFSRVPRRCFCAHGAEELSFGPKNLGFPELVIQENVTGRSRRCILRKNATPPLALSFGQQKRISIAAILAMRSRILMMDEPTAGQDYWNYTSFMDAILQMPGFDAVVFITHDVDLAVTYSNRILLFYSGRLVGDGPPEEVLKDEELLRSCRVLPTSLLRLNLKMLPKTGQFLGLKLWRIIEFNLILIQIRFGGGK